MKKTFTIQLDTDITIDFTTWGLSDAEQKDDCAMRSLVINHYLEQCGMDEFEITEANSNSLFDAMAQVVRAQNDYFLAHKKEFEYTD